MLTTLVETGLIVNGTGFETTKLVPLNSVTKTLTVPALVRSDAGTLASSWLLLTKVVDRGVPLNCTCVPCTKPVPITTSVKPALPCVAENGLMLVMTGDVRFENGVMLNMAALEVPEFSETKTLTFPALTRSDAGMAASSWLGLR